MQSLAGGDPAFSTEALYEHAPCCLLVTDADGTIRRVNATFCSLTGYEPETLVGKRKLQDLMTVGGRIFHQTHWSPLLALQGSVAEVKLDIVYRDGRVIPMMINAARRSTGEHVRLEIALFVAQDRHKYEYELLLERKRAEELALNHYHQANALRESEERFRNTFDGAATGIAITDAGGAFVQANAAYCAMLEYTEDELLRLTPRSLTHPDDWPHIQVVEDDVLQGKYPRAVVEKRYLTKSGSTVWIRASISVMSYAERKPKLMVRVAEDITARKQSEQEIIALNADLDIKVQKRTAELQAANKELESFAYSVSHDLRSPLSTIAGFSQLLEKADGNSISAKGRHYLSRIQAGSKVMGEIIEGLLALAQLSREKLKSEQTNLTAIAHLVEVGCREQNPDRTVEFLIEDDLFTLGDPRLLLAVVQNLIGNAWKFTANTKAARVEFFCEQCLDGTRCFVVRDNGAGFDMNFADKLFGTFERLHSPSEFAGTGVGLAIVKRVVQKHGGRIWATSKVGEGATFRFTLSTTQDVQ